MSDLDIEATRLGVDKTAPDAVQRTIELLEGERNGTT